MHTVSQLLSTKQTTASTDVHSVGKGKSVLEAARVMNEYHIGSLVVTDTLGELVGIISERDILTRIVTTERSASETMVGEVMTTKVICCDPETTLAQARQIMTDRRIRHLPVIDNGMLLGMISIGDLNAARNENLTIEVKSMREYITHG
jgi:CBS domain-containing protein